ncbi:MAG: hypothetical protein R6U95_06830 [Bacteroidales bacterium]
MKTTYIIIFIIVLVGFIGSCGMQKTQLHDEYITTIGSLHEEKADVVSVHVRSGDACNHPTYAIWIETMNGDFLQTLFVTRSYATGNYAHAYIDGYRWAADSGKSVRPASLPYWKHKVDSENIPDAVTSATPEGSVMVQRNLTHDLQKFRVLLEVNQAWDNNAYWTNTKYPDSFEYRTSGQPSVIYAATVDVQSTFDTVYLNPIGHGHYAGENGYLYTDIRSLTTALDIFESVYVTFKKE